MTSRYFERNILARLLSKLYIDSRVSVRKLSQEMNISYSRTSKALSELERRYRLNYTLDIDITKLGFTEDRIICIRFGEKPDPEKLKRYLESQPLVQNAYLAYGDYDLILHATALSKTDYLAFQFRTRVELSKYKPVFEQASLDDYAEGFLPVARNLINLSSSLSADEKRLLSLLVENSRARLKDMVRNTEFTTIKILYMVGKLKKKGVINKFTCTVQRPDKRIFMLYTVTATYVPAHKPKLQAEFLRSVIAGDGSGDLTSDYSVVCDTSGHFDSALFCNFTDTKAVSLMGPELMKRTWAIEKPVIKSCILSDVLKGGWPFQKNGYAKWKNVLGKIQKNPMKFDLLQ